MTPPGHCSAMLATSGSAAGGDAELANFLEQADADRDFLRRANVGGERMGDEDVARVRHIAQAYTWGGPNGAQRPLLSTEEADNLCVRAGTLNAAEREVITLVRVNPLDGHLTAADVAAKNT